ncbi:MAG: CbtB-domain containing protein [Pseudomonadota bacterium]
MNAQTHLSSSLTHAPVRTAAIAAVALGGFLVLMVGFSPMPAVHNAAHDTRHSAAFPCH